MEDRRGKIEDGRWKQLPGTWWGRGEKTEESKKCPVLGGDHASHSVDPDDQMVLRSPDLFLEEGSFCISYSKFWGYITLVRRVPRRGRITEKDVKFLDPKHEPVNPRLSINAFLSVHVQKEGSAVGVLLQDGVCFDG
jgi:hypothetical protein